MDSNSKVRAARLWQWDATACRDISVILGHDDIARHIKELEFLAKSTKPLSDKLSQNFRFNSCSNLQLLPIAMRPSSPI